ncbi:MAG TPA: hypothetical protein VFP11_04350 [Candidatus Angelobacter sp.]|nr:hypothetical protein [Candidatus Angelobacter sp.]
MKFLQRMCFVVLASGLALGQTAASDSGSAGTGSVADELKALREAISQQQKQISQQQQQIQTLEQQLENKTSGTPHVADASMRTVPVNATVTQETEKPKESPLSFRIGGTDFTPGGFVDFENIFRSTNTGGSSATSFGAIPFSNTVQGHLTEFRSTGQYSRYNLKVSGKYGDNNVVGYIEGDFNGNDPANVFVTSNSHTNRLRLYWLDLKRGKWEFLGGNSWGMETPNRNGLSPMPADLALTLGEDANVHVGIPYTRAAEFRAVYHFSDNFQWGVALQNPQQFVGAGEVIFPFAFNAQLGPQFDANNNNGAPNVFPDVHTKMAWDAGASRKFHFELGGLMTSVKITNLPIGGTTFVHHSKIGGGIHSAINFELFKGFRFLANGMWGNGIGRYMIGLGPQAVVVPIATGPATFDLDVSMVHAGAATMGFEATAGKSQFGFYYGGNYFGRNAFQDVTSPLVTKPFIGFGGINSPNSANRAIQEGSIDWTQTFWKNPQYGAVLMVTQFSYLTRAPWFVAAGAPKNAHLGMGYLSIRYVLP